MRPSTARHLLSVFIRETSLSIDEPTENWLCERLSPPVLPDIFHATTQDNLDIKEYIAYKHPFFDSVDKLQGFEETKFADIAAFEELCEEKWNAPSSKIR